ncbi:MAG: PE domain-containing protein [Hyphomicrobium sp.]
MCGAPPTMSSVEVNRGATRSRQLKIEKMAAKTAAIAPSTASTALASISRRLSKTSDALAPTTMTPVPPAAISAAVTALKTVYQSNAKKMTPTTAAMARVFRMLLDTDGGGWVVMEWLRSGTLP